MQVYKTVLIFIFLMFFSFNMNKWGLAIVFFLFDWTVYLSYTSATRLLHSEIDNLMLVDIPRKTYKLRKLQNLSDKGLSLIKIFTFEDQMFCNFLLRAKFLAQRLSREYGLSCASFLTRQYHVTIYRVFCLYRWNLLFLSHRTILLS